MTIDSTITGPVLEVWALAGALLGTLLLLAGTLWAGARVAGQVRALWQAVRGYREPVLAGLDEPSDPLIRRLERVTGIPAAVWAAFLPAFLEALASGLDRVLMDPPAAGSSE